ncbi:MAG: AmmeMemoRadiSam system protein [bacterium]|nr:AmmeMemoRadiSam system protein [bacterium]
MRIAALMIVVVPSLALAQAAVYPVGTGRPTTAEARKEMGIPSTDELRGQLDSVGYASKPEAMAKVWELAAQAPAPMALGAPPPPGVVGLIGPHDDYVYAARVDRQIYPLVTAKTVVLVGVFHRYRRFGAHDQMVFDSYRAWRAPDGEIKVSPLRDELIAALPKDEAIKDATAHDSEHSVEAIAYFLKHARPDVEIVPVFIPAASFARLTAMATHHGGALAATMKRHKLQLGRDVAVVISTDGTHYGSDFSYVPFGAGGVEAFIKAMVQDRTLVETTLAGALSLDKAQKFFAAVVNPDKVDEYRMPWCGRFSVPFGLVFLAETARRLGLANPRGVPLALGVSVDTPELKVRDVGVAPTAPANLYHFVTQPGVAFVTDK